MSELVSDPVVILAGACVILVLGMLFGCLLNCVVRQRGEVEDWWRDV